MAYANTTTEVQADEGIGSFRPGSRIPKGPQHADDHPTATHVSEAAPDAAAAAEHE